MRHLDFTRRHATTTTTILLFIVLSFVIHVQCWCGISTATTAATKSKRFQQSPKDGTATTIQMNDNHSNEDPDEPFDILHPTLLRPTMRNFKTTTSTATTTATQSIPETERRDMQSYTQAMLERHEQMKPFTNVEIDIILNSLRNVIPITNDESNHNDDSDTMRAMLQELQDRVVPQYAHLSHKNWTMTGENAKQWQATLFPTVPDNNNNNSPPQRHMFERIYREGNWDGAVSHHHHHQQQQQKVHLVKPWAVLVTGVNGIRKTTSIYQDWFPLLLQEAIVSPPSESDLSTMDQTHIEISNLPCGSNTFFRQLDHMIATLCNEEFIRLYTFARDLLVEEGMTQHPQQPTADIIQLYSNLKAAIFSRYRTISELLGVILLREAQRIPINCMVETSGRDVAMFHYIDHFFPASTYHKLALHFTINELDYAKTSVDQRMIDEIQSGVAALDKNSIFDIINTNVGGPYGSEVLSGIQADSDRVWKENVMVNDGGVGHDWYKATIQINAHASEPWTAQAVKPDGSLGTIFQFQRK